MVQSPSTGAAKKLSDASVSYLKQELATNKFRGGQKDLSASDRTNKIAKLQAHCNALPEGKVKDKLTKLLEQLQQHSSVIETVQQEGESNRSHVSTEADRVITELRQLHIKGDTSDTAAASSAVAGDQAETKPAEVLRASLKLVAGITRESREKKIKCKYLLPHSPTISLGLLGYPRN